MSCGRKFKGEIESEHLAVEDDAFVDKCALNIALSYLDHLRHGGMVNSNTRVAQQVRPKFVMFTLWKSKETDFGKVESIRTKSDQAGALTELAQCLKDHPQTMLAVGELEISCNDFLKKTRAVKYTWSLEICPEKMFNDDTIKLHRHLAVELNQGNGPSLYATNGILRASHEWKLGHSLTNFCNAPTHKKNKPVRERTKNTFPLHYYLQMNKAGVLHYKTNFKAFSAFQVNPRWITSHIQGGKLSWDSAREQYRLAGSNVRNNIENVNYLRDLQKHSFVVGQITYYNGALKAQQKPWVVCTALDDFLAELKEVRMRYKFFVMIGSSCTAKTQRLKHVFVDPAYVLEINCASGEETDLRGYDESLHEGILFDEGKAEMVLRQKKLFQAGNAYIQLASSSTNCHSYRRYVYRTALMISSNTWKEELEAIEKRSPCDAAWLKDNSIVVDIGNKVQYEVNAVASPPPGLIQEENSYIQI